MRPLGPLEEAQEVFKTFKTSSTKTISTDQVFVQQWVRFPVGCLEEAKETLTIDRVEYEFRDGGDSFGYLLLKQVVSGPYKDGNREQIVDDCKIQTYVEIEPYIEGVTNRIDVPESSKTLVIAAKNKPAARTVALQEVPYQVEVRHGCQSNEASPWIFAVILVLSVTQKIKEWSV